MNGENGVFVFPDAATGRGTGSIDPGLLALLNQNGGFGNGGNWMWLIFLWMMWSQNGNGFGNGFGANGTGFLANQANQEAGTNLIIQAINGRADVLSQLAQITNSSVETVKTGLNTIQSAIQTVGSQVGMSGLQVINSVQAGNASLSQQLCECCCNMRYDLSQQTNALQAQAATNAAAAQLQLANHDASVRLQLAQQEAADQLAVCQQTNQLGSQADRNTNNILSAIQSQNVLLEQRFCEIKEREMQDKINTQGDIITQLRGQITADNQTLQFNAAMKALDDKIDAIAAKQPNTVPVTWPNLTAINNTPNPSFGYGMYGGWGNGFGGSIVF